ncbi:NAD(P)-dependent oxidoreductase [Paucibacter sp. AS339]|uniref:NAD-dependent epimerase/dehydratase family protein n=1 Tax=Paucibacter hankyongi TaxID=3133434 RepID=UPI0030983EFB
MDSMALSATPLGLPPEDLAHVLDGVGGDWQALRGQRLLLTGGTGFIGKWLLGSFLWANRTLALNARVLVLSRDVASFRVQHPELAAAPEIEWLQGDVRSFTLAPGQSCAWAIHAATDVALNPKPAEVLDVCVLGTQNLLMQARQSGVGRLLLLSSGAVYGRQPSAVERLSEDFSGAPDCLTPSSAYGEGKRVSELLCAMAAAETGMEIPVARCFAFVGPHLPLDRQFAIGNFIGAALRGEDLLIQGDGTPLRSYLYAADLALWLWKLLFRGKSSRAYNVGGHESVSIAQLAQRVTAALGAVSAVKIARQPQSGVPAQAYLPDLQRIESELSLRVRIDLDEAIQRTARWAQKARP